MHQATFTSGSMGWTVLPGTLNADGSQGLFKWSAFSPFGGTWGYEETREAATQRAREEYTRLTGEET